MVALPYITIFLVGLIIGSFLNVCAYRLPRRESILWPGSHCTHCDAVIKAWDNVPVLSYVWLRGRCRSCGSRISIRYPLLELANAAGYVLIVSRFGWTSVSVVYAVFYSALLVITATDLTHRMIPNLVTIPGTLLGVCAAATVLPTGLLNALLGIGLGAGLLWLAAWASPYLFGKDGMGGGDIKLLAMVGAVLGWEPALLTIFVGAISGSLVGLMLIGFKIIRRQDYLPFGPFLALGAVVSLFFHENLMAWYLSFIARPL